MWTRLGACRALGRLDVMSDPAGQSRTSLAHQEASGSDSGVDSRQTLGDEWRVTLIDSASRFKQLEGDWKRLFGACPDLPVFSSWEWMSCWWKHYGQSWHLSVLTAMDSTGALVGIAPLVWQWRFEGPVRVRYLTFMANEGASATHLDVLARDTDRDRVSRLFLRFLDDCDQEWDVLEFRHLAPESVFGRHVHDVPGRQSDVPECVCPYVPLSPDWESYRGALRKKVRRNLLYFDRLLGREMTERATFHLISDPHEVDLVLDSMIEMHLHRIRNSTLGDPAFAAFHHDFAQEALEAGWLRLYTLDVGASRIAVIYCLKYGETVSAYLSGFDENWARYSPGRQIASHAIRSAIEEGAVEFDWMQGDCRYKYEWTRRTRADRHLVVARTRRGAAWVTSRRLRTESRTALRGALPVRLRRALRPAYRSFQRLRRHKRAACRPRSPSAAPARAELGASTRDAAI